MGEFLLFCCCSIFLLHFCFPMLSNSPQSHFWHLHTGSTICPPLPYQPIATLLLPITTLTSRMSRQSELISVNNLPALLHHHQHLDSRRILSSSSTVTLLLIAFNLHHNHLQSLPSVKISVDPVNFPVPQRSAFTTGSLFHVCFAHQTHAAWPCASKCGKVPTKIVTIQSMWTCSKIKTVDISLPRYLKSAHFLIPQGHKMVIHDALEQ